MNTPQMNTIEHLKWSAHNRTLTGKGKDGFRYVVEILANRGSAEFLAEAANLLTRLRPFFEAAKTEPKRDFWDDLRTRTHAVMCQENLTQVTLAAALGARFSQQGLSAFLRGRGYVGALLPENLSRLMRFLQEHTPEEEEG